jgi:hypothetical protein
LTLASRRRHIPEDNALQASCSSSTAISEFFFFSFSSTSIAYCFLAYNLQRIIQKVMRFKSAPFMKEYDESVQERTTY